MHWELVMKAVVAVAIVLAMSFNVQTAFAGSSGDAAVSLDDVTKLVGDKEAAIRAAESTLAPIRSRSDLSEYLSTHATSPVTALSQRSAKLFLDSLVFTEYGLASYRTAEIESELTPRQAYAILSLFGVQQSIAQLQIRAGTPEELEALHNIGPVIDDDHADYRCQPPATCLSTMAAICIGQNCKGSAQ